MLRWFLSLCLALGLALSAVPRAYPANTHGAFSPVQELGAWMGNGWSPYVPSGCLPDVPSSSLILAAFACQGYVRGASGEIIYVDQPARAVGPVSNVNGLDWLAIHKDTSTAVGGWNRQPGTHYLWQRSTTRPADPSGGAVVARLQVVSAVITQVLPLFASNPRGTINAGDVRYGLHGAASGAANKTALQLAMTHAALSGRVLELPCGSFTVNTGLSFPALPTGWSSEIILEGCGNPDLMYNGNPNVTQWGGTVLQAVGTTDFISMGPTDNPVTGVSLRGLLIRGPGTPSGDGVHLEGASGIIRMNFRDVSIMNFRGTGQVGFYCNFCENGAAYNLAVNNNAIGMVLINASNSNQFYNFVAQYNTEAAAEFLGVSTNHVYGGLLQHNERNGFYLKGAVQMGFYGIHFEDNNSTATAGKYAILLHGDADGSVVQDTVIENNRFTSPRDIVFAEGTVAGPVTNTIFVGNRWQVANPGVIISDANVIYTTFFGNPPGISDSGTATQVLGGGAINVLLDTPQIYTETSKRQSINGGEIEFRCGQPSPGQSRCGFFGTNGGFWISQWLSGQNITAPAAPNGTTEHYKIYSVLNGGKVELRVRFPTGASQVLATEP